MEVYLLSFGGSGPGTVAWKVLGWSEGNATTVGRVIVRSVRESDVESLHAGRLCGVTLDETAGLVRSAVEEEGGGEYRFLVAVEEGGAVAGMTTVRRLDHRMCRHRAELGGFVILPAARGTGLARRIVGAAGDWARQWGCSVLEVSCRGGTRAEAAYVGLGFQVWGRLPGGFHDRGGVVFDEVRLWMALSAEGL
ncbi:GNAT family N-acetyltransferase [Kribbella sp. NPDC056345]|uniref:GNAT family N-acetyltransferase n=1 Tax=Kribbella sp. NPDC056345 TaxID=3345789 RepID=UPI0035D7BCA4